MSNEAIAQSQESDRNARKNKRSSMSNEAIAQSQESQRKLIQNMTEVQRCEVRDLAKTRQQRHRLAAQPLLAAQPPETWPQTRPTESLSQEEIVLEIGQDAFIRLRPGQSQLTDDEEEHNTAYRSSSRITIKQYHHLTTSSRIIL